MALVTHQQHTHEPKGGLVKTLTGFVCFALLMTGCTVSVSPNEPIYWGHQNKVMGETFDVNSSYVRLEGPSYDRQAYIVLSNAYAPSCDLARISDGREKIVIFVPARVGTYTNLVPTRPYSYVGFVSRQTMRQEDARSYTITITSIDDFTVTGHVRASIDDDTKIDLQFSIDATCR